MMSLFSEESLSRAYDEEIARNIEQKYEAKLKLARQTVERETAQKEARQFALRLLRKGMTEDETAELTNLSVQEVNELKNEIEQTDKQQYGNEFTFSAYLDFSVSLL